MAAQDLPKETHDMKQSTRKNLGRGILSLSIVTAIGIAMAMAAGTASSGNIPIVVYKNPSCGCCSRWAEQLDKQGFDAEVRPVNNLNAIKQEVGIPTGMNSCHTAKVDGYYIEGHVPAADIQRLLKEKPDIAGLTVPGMPMGSPGMEVPGRKPQPYKVYSIDKQGKTHLFASH